VVPVVSKTGQPLMPTTSAKARRLIRDKRATYFYKKGIFCVRLNYDSETTFVQDVACGIDPGGSWEAMTVKSKSKTYLNTQNDATNWVKGAIKTRREMRRGRRFRKTPCRQPQWNRGCLKGERLSPSTKARWQTKLRVVNILRSIFPISHYIVEDIAAKTKPGKSKWNKSFSPLEVGKNWFYSELATLGHLTTVPGYRTKQYRDALGLMKSKSNQNSFKAHCVDSWVLANSVVGGHLEPDNTSIRFFTPLRFHRRQLHRFQPSSGVGRRRYGGTSSNGFKRGSIIRHQKWGVAYVGGCLGSRISLHSLGTGKRITQTAKVDDCKFLGYNSWRWHLDALSSPRLKPGVSSA
jgi:RRXRR protein